MIYMTRFRHDNQMRIINKFHHMQTTCPRIIMRSRSTLTCSPLRNKFAGTPCNCVHHVLETSVQNSVWHFEKCPGT